MTPRQPIPTDNGRVDDLTVDHTPTDQTLVNQAKDVKQSSRKQTSAFNDLCKSLQTIDSVNEYVRTNHMSALRQHKDMNSLLQSLSNRNDEFYEALFDNSKAEVLVLLERIVELTSTIKKQSNSKGGAQGASHQKKEGNGIFPAALHEFCLRAEYYGVKKTAWGTAAASLELLPGATSPALLTPKEMLSKIASIDPQGRMIRRIEMCNDIPSLLRTVKEFNTVFLAQKASSPEVDVYVALGRLLSKCRRLFEILARGGSSPASQNAEEEEGAEPPSGDSDALPSIAKKYSALTPELKQSIEGALKEVMALYETVTGQTRGASHTLAPPIVKMKTLISWAQMAGVIAHTDAYDAQTEKLAKVAEESMVSAAQSLECVMKLKSVSLSTSEEEGSGAATQLSTIVDEMVRTDEESGLEVLAISTPDVLSSLATAAAALKDLAVKDRVVRVLVATQRHVLGDSASLPRRALHFVAAERNRVKQEKRALELSAKRARDEEDNDNAEDNE